MKVNGVDIARYNARQWNIEPGKRTVTNASEMLDGVSVPAMAAPSFGLREYVVTIRIRGGSRTEIWNNASRILSLFRGVSEVEMDGIGGAGTHMFTLSLKGVDQEEYGRMKAGWGILKLSCVGYEHGGAVTAWLEKEFAFSDAVGAYVTSEYTFAIEEVELRYSSLPSPPTTTGVIADIILSQTNICTEDGFFSGLVENYYPIYARITIEGLCRDAAGKDMGALRFNVDPHMQKEMGSPVLDPCEDGWGYREVTIDGISGKTCGLANRERPETIHLEPNVYISGMPAPLIWGVPGQEIRVEITSCYPQIYKPCYKIGFSYTPIYL